MRFAGGGHLRGLLGVDGDLVVAAKPAVGARPEEGEDDGTGLLWGGNDVGEGAEGVDRVGVGFIGGGPVVGGPGDLEVCGVDDAESAAANHSGDGACGAE